jgi:hypothetical protein
MRDPPDLSGHVLAQAHRPWLMPRGVILPPIAACGLAFLPMHLSPNRLTHPAPMGARKTHKDTDNFLVTV